MLSFSCLRPRAPLPVGKLTHLSFEEFNQNLFMYIDANEMVFADILSSSLYDWTSVSSVASLLKPGMSRNVRTAPFPRAPALVCALHRVFPVQLLRPIAVGARVACPLGP
jgi:hypothetical protein